jgi:LemA protein
MVLLIVITVIVIMSAGSVVMIYNSLVQVRNNVDKAWKNIDVLLEQRHDEIPKLVETCGAYMQHERETLDTLTRLRTGYRQAADVMEKVAIENQLNREMQRLNLVMEQYPDLKAIQAFTKVLDRVSSLESAIADRREFFNDSINIYNIQIERFPSIVFARLLNYQRKEYLEVAEEKKADVKMNFRH